MSDGWENIQVDGSEMRAYVSTPEGAGPFPAMVVVQHAPGVDAFIQEITRRLAEKGYVGIAPDLYHRDDPDSTDFMAKMGKLKDDEIASDINAALDMLRTRGLASGDIGITGFCMGGRVVFLMAGREPDTYKGGVPFYPAIMKESWGDGPSPFELMANIKCPILGFFGGDDQNPTLQEARDMDAELTKHGVEHDFHSYAGAGHAYMNFNNPNMYRKGAAEDSWPIFLAFLEEHVKREKASVSS